MLGRTGNERPFRPLLAIEVMHMCLIGMEMLLHGGGKIRIVDNDHHLQIAEQRSRTKQRSQFSGYATRTSTPLVAGKTLILFDEVQECPEVVTQNNINEAASCIGKDYIIKEGRATGTWQ